MMTCWFQSVSDETTKKYAAFRKKAEEGKKKKKSAHLCNLSPNSQPQGVLFVI